MIRRCNRGKTDEDHSDIGNTFLWKNVLISFSFIAINSCKDYTEIKTKKLEPRHWHTRTSCSTNKKHKKADWIQLHWVWSTNFVFQIYTNGSMHTNGRVLCLNIILNRRFKRENDASAECNGWPEFLCW